VPGTNETVGVYKIFSRNFLENSVIEKIFQTPIRKIFTHKWFGTEKKKKGNKKMKKIFFLVQPTHTSHQK
jgi:hypothetical protein